MFNQFEGRQPLIIIPTILKSGTYDLAVVNARNLTTIYFTTRVTYHASATGAITVSAYFSPDGKNFDTVALGSIVITVSAGATVQRTTSLSTPDSGWCRIVAVNADDTYNATDLMLWSCIVNRFVEDRASLPST